MGMFARPFGYEVNLGLCRPRIAPAGQNVANINEGERDLGAMISFDLPAANHPLRLFES